MIYYDSADIYVLSLDTKVAQISAIQKIQDALLAQALQAASKGAISEYMLNDGQTIIKATYRSAKEVKDAWLAFEQIKQIFINSINGRSVRLIDSKNLLRNASFR